MTQTPISSPLISRITQAARYVISGVTPNDWFGPDEPLAPIAPDNVAGRKFDYPVGYNTNYTPRSAEALSFNDLRALADNCDILRSVIETRKDQMEALQWNVRVVPTDTNTKNSTSDQKARIAKITAFLHYPDKENSFSGWLRQILEDMFVIDAACLYKRRMRSGELYALEIIDGATIKILIDDSGRLPVSPDPAYQQVLKGVPAVDYTREELMYLKHNPRSHKVYGYSHVEQVMITVNILIRRALHQLEYYRDGSQPDAFIGLPKDWNQEQILAFQKHFDAMLSGNSAMRRRLRFMPGEFKYQETKPPPLKDAYDDFLARIICFVFSISPEPFVSHVNRATAESSQARAIDEGLAPLQCYVSGIINRIIHSEFASPDLEFVWQDIREQDPKDAASIDVAYVSAGIMTVDEVRGNLGLAPLGKTEGVKKNFSDSSEVGKFNPNHLGSGPGGGQFTTASRNGTSSGVSNNSQEAKRTEIKSSSLAAKDPRPDLPQDNDTAEASYPIETAILASTPVGRVVSALSAVGNEVSSYLGESASSSASGQSASVEDLLMPDGERIGQSGSNGDIREVSGNAEDSRDFFDKLTQDGELINDPSYKNGIRMTVPSGGSVGFRTYSTASPNTAATLDINIPNIKISKIKFNP